MRCWTCPSRWRRCGPRTRPAPGSRAPRTSSFRAAGPTSRGEDRPRAIRLEISYAAGGAFAAATGNGELRASLDGLDEQVTAITGPGLYELAHHERHEAHELRLTASDGIELYSLAFSATVP